MVSGVFTQRHRAWALVALAAFLAAAAVVSLYRWTTGFTPGPLLSEATDAMEAVLDRQIIAAISDFTLYNRVNIAVQSATILLGIAATLLTASTTPGNAERLKIATVSVTALTAALIGVQSTFHLRENIQTNATAFTRLIFLETDYVYARDHLAEMRTDASALRRDTEQKLTRIRSERMLALANIGAGPQQPERPSIRMTGAE